MPTQAELTLVEEEYKRTGKILPNIEDFLSWGAHVDNSVNAAKYLVTLDMPEARKAAYEFRDQLAKKWANSSDLAKTKLNTLDTNLSNAEAAVKSGAVPWKMQN